MMNSLFQTNFVLLELLQDVQRVQGINIKSLCVGSHTLYFQIIQFELYFPHLICQHIIGSDLQSSQSKSTIYLHVHVRLNLQF